MTKNTPLLYLIRDRNPSVGIPSLAEIYSMTYKVLAELPEEYQPFILSINVHVENFPHEKTLRNHQLTDRYDLLGLYKGVPLPYKSLHNKKNISDTIYLFRCPLIRYAKENQETVEELINQVVIHEIGHHFGFKDEELELFSVLENGGRNRD